MKKTTLLLCCMLIGPLAARAQEAAAGCNCRADFEYVRQLVEDEHPGFRLNVSRLTPDEYEGRIADVQRLTAGNGITRDSCAAYINSYLQLIRDGHLRVSAATAPPKSERNLTADMHLKALDRETYYLRLPTFFKSYWRQIDAFYDSIIPLLATRPNLIIDLRNNTGGGERMYLQLLKYLKKNRHSPSRIALLFNRYCASACEEFTVRLMDHRKVTTFGENSYGAIGYGEVNRYRTPHCALTFDLPTQKRRRYLGYELEGVPPEHVLTGPPETWVEEVVGWLEEL